MDDLKRLFHEANEEFLLGLSWSEDAAPAIAAGNVIVRRDMHGEPIGFIVWQVVGDVWIERLLYVVPRARGGISAYRLLRDWTNRATLAHITKLHAGSSLGHTDRARRLYESLGFKTHLRFERNYHV